MNRSNVLHKAHNEWASRPDDERFVSLDEMYESMLAVQRQSRALVCANRDLSVQPVEYDGGQKSVAVYGPNGTGYEPTHWAFGQLSSLAGAPAGYLRELPPELICDNLNYSLKFRREIEDVGVLIQKNGSNVLRAATGPGYGRIWNSEIVSSLIKRFGNGTDGEWRVPGEFGKAVTVTKANTTLYASDRDMFVFLANESNRIEWNGRLLARGFFLWNSEVGSKKFGIACFVFDFVCCNRYVWGAQGYEEFSFRHSSGAPHRFLEQIQPALNKYASGEGKEFVHVLEDAKQHKIDAPKLDDFLATRFGKNLVQPIKAAHLASENRSIENRWDALNAVTLVAQSYHNQDTRVELEREAGKLLVTA